MVKIIQNIINGTLDFKTRSKFGDVIFELVLLTSGLVLSFTLHYKY